VLHTARWKYRTQKCRKKLPSAHRRTTLSSCIFVTNAYAIYRQSEKNLTPYLHFRGLLPFDRILPRAKYTLHPSLAFSYVGSVTARHSNSGHQPICDVEQRAPPIFGRAVITFGIGLYSSSFFLAYSQRSQSGCLSILPYRYMM